MNSNPGRPENNPELAQQYTQLAGWFESKRPIYLLGDDDNIIAEAMAKGHSVDVNPGDALIPFTVPISERNPQLYNQESLPPSTQQLLVLINQLVSPRHLISEHEKAQFRNGTLLTPDQQAATEKEADLISLLFEDTPAHLLDIKLEEGALELHSAEFEYESEVSLLLAVAKEVEEIIFNSESVKKGIAAVDKAMKKYLQLEDIPFIPATPTFEILLLCILGKDYNYITNYIKRRHTQSKQDWSNLQAKSRSPKAQKSQAALLKLDRRPEQMPQIAYQGLLDSNLYYSRGPRQLGSWTEMVRYMTKRFGRGMGNDLYKAFRYPTGEGRLRAIRPEVIEQTIESISDLSVRPSQNSDQVTTLKQIGDRWIDNRLLEAYVPTAVKAQALVVTRSNVRRARGAILHSSYYRQVSGQERPQEYTPELYPELDEIVELYRPTFTDQIYIARIQQFFLD